MEITRRYLIAYPTGFAAYLALQRALMYRFLARGGTPEEFCRRLAPVFRRRYAGLLGSATAEPVGVPEPGSLEPRALLAPPTPRLRQERLPDAA
jgi:hypothetical protein